MSTGSGRGPSAAGPVPPGPHPSLPGHPPIRPAAPSPTRASRCLPRCPSPLAPELPPPVLGSLFGRSIAPPVPVSPSAQPGTSPAPPHLPLRSPGLPHPSRVLPLRPPGPVSVLASPSQPGSPFHPPAPCPSRPPFPARCCDPLGSLPALTPERSLPVFPRRGARPGLCGCQPWPWGCVGQSRVVPGGAAFLGAAAGSCLARQLEGGWGMAPAGPQGCSGSIPRQDRPGTAETGVLRHHQDRDLPEPEAALRGSHGRSVLGKGSASQLPHLRLWAVCFAPSMLCPSHPQIPTGRDFHYWALWFCLPVRARIGFSPDGNLTMPCTACAPYSNTPSSQVPLFDGISGESQNH